MAQIFPRSANAVFRATVMGVIGLVAATVALAYGIHGGGYFTRQDLIRHQPVPFSHRHHVESMGIDCRYCHWLAEESHFAGIPPTHTCMGCHSQIWAESPMLKPVRDSYESGEPLVWNRVHDLPDFVYFNHSIHVAKGMGCATCHGRVDEMALVWQENTLHMAWCLDCHRNPEKYVRPKDQIYNMAWNPTAREQAELGPKLVEAYDIQTQDHCYTCHR
ncbi:MAG TPA: cytochrome c3 family protein [Myxococcales bacterium LLY-WYZ-16_1]|nr:cytochrome c3 family protein [Myxococcales bacterium LLY-WYZ-16_1]